MKSFEASIAIEAPPEKVWGVLMDTPAYPEWDPFCDRIEGEVALGGKLKAYSKLSPGRAFPVRVTELEPSRRMTWTGGMPLGLFTGRRTFSLEGDGSRTDFTMREVFSGPMLFLIGGSLPDMTEAFDAFARGLKARAEAAG
ncbi:MAG: SRPBCC family protein [Sandaracinaceae bacterium]